MLDNHLKPKEYAVPCKWCGARQGEPCKNQNGTPYDGKFHQIRTELYKTTMNQKYWDDKLK